MEQAAALGYSQSVSSWKEPDLLTLVEAASARFDNQQLMDKLRKSSKQKQHLPTTTVQVRPVLFSTLTTPKTVPAVADTGAGIATPTDRRSFLEELKLLLDDDSYSDVLTWMPDGQAFTLVHPKLFAKDVMPRILHIRTMSSFLRKLNQLGFARMLCKKTMNLDIFHRPGFARDRRGQEKCRIEDDRDILNNGTNDLPPPSISLPPHSHKDTLGDDSSPVPNLLARVETIEEQQQPTGVPSFSCVSRSADASASHRHHEVQTNRSPTASPQSIRGLFSEENKIHHHQPQRGYHHDPRNDLSKNDDTDPDDLVSIAIRNYYQLMSDLRQQHHQHTPRPLWHESRWMQPMDLVSGSALKHPALGHQHLPPSLLWFAASILDDATENAASNIRAFYRSSKGKR